jgi:hypothetical protein
MMIPSRYRTGGQTECQSPDKEQGTGNREGGNYNGGKGKGKGRGNEMELPTLKFSRFSGHLQSLGRVARQRCFMKGRPPRYSEEFRREAVRLVESWKPLKQIARDLGVSAATLRMWRRALGKATLGYRTPVEFEETLQQVS